MKAITIWQPWATLIMEGAKPYEFRTWAAPKSMAGTRIAIHAGARKIERDEVLDLMNRLDERFEHGTTGLKAELARPILQRILDAHRDSFTLPLASILGTAVMGTSKRADTIFKGVPVADSDRDKHMYAWPFGAIRRFNVPVPWRGAQGFWDCPDDVVTRV